MTTIRLQPMRRMDPISTEMNKFFESFFNAPGQCCAEGADCWQPEVDIIEESDKVLVHVDLPGMNKDDIKIRVEDNVLTIEGERKFEKAEHEQNYHQAERAFGTFSRTFNLPGIVAGDKISANYKNGVLSIDLPKIEEVKPKEIPISIG